MSRRDSSQVPVVRIIALLLAVLAILAAGCGSTDDSSVVAWEPDSSVVAWEPLPVDGKCRSGMVLRKGESCTHEYSYQVGTSIDESGTNAIFEEVSKDFFVDDDGRGNYDGLGPTDEISSSTTVGDMDFRFIGHAQSDGTFYIEEATSSEPGESEGRLDTAGAVDCSVGMVLSAGESCWLVGGGEFSVESDGTGCFGGFICSGGSVEINEFSATKDDGVWTIHSIAGTTIR